MKRAMLAKGEYEGASFLLHGFEDVDEVSVSVDECMPNGMRIIVR